MCAKNRIVVLSLIIILGVFLRFYRLGSVPSGLYVDEAGIGYNAYSLLKTGLDEYGKSWPVLMRRFGDFSPALYNYLTVIPVLVFGLNEFSVRFWSAVAGVVAIYLVYLIAERSLWAAGLIAMSPWGLMMSRVGTEGHFAFCLWLGGIYAYQLARKKNWWMVVSFLLFGLAINCYQASRLLVPLTIIGLFIFLPINQWWKKRTVYVSGLILLLLVLPQLWLVGNSGFGVRAGGLFYKETVRVMAEKINWLPYPLAWIYSFVREFLSQLVAYFNPYTLFYLGDADLQRSVPGVSVFFQWMVVPYLMGIHLVLKRIKTDKAKLILVTAITAVVVPALTKDPFSSIRSQGLILPMVLAMTMAIENWVKNSGKRKMIVFIFMFVYL